MIWNKYVIETTAKDAGIISGVLMDFGIFDIQIENNVQLSDEELNKMYAGFVRNLPPDDGACSIDFYLEFEGNEAADEKLSQIKEGLKEAEELFGIEPASIYGEVVDSESWENNWKEFFKPFLAGRIAVKPSWEELPLDMECDTVVEIDPGMAFGTGLHETTRLCLKGIENFLKPGAGVLDLGTGSGILTIAALKLGAGRAVSVDIDMQAVTVAGENLSLNGISPEKYKLLCGNILNDEELDKKITAQGGFDLVLANILADVIIPLTARVHEFMCIGGIFVSSGIINDKEEAVAVAFDANRSLEIIDVSRCGEWVSISAKRIS